MRKGIFWFPCARGEAGELVFTGEILALPVPCDEDGTPKVPTSFNAKNGCSNTHKASWTTVTAGRKDLRKVPWDQFPSRGRVEIAHGRALVFMNPQILNCADYLERIKETFQIGFLDVRVKIDNSAHYQCRIVEDA